MRWSLIGTALLALAGLTAAHRPRRWTRPILAPLASGQVVRIGPTAGTGTPTRDYGIGATDLCEFMELPSGILQVCGDSFAGHGVGFGGWYAPIALHVETDSIDDPTGVRYDGATGIDKPLLAEPTPPDSSQQPAGVVQINRENYMMVTTVRDRRRRPPRRPCARHHLAPLYLDTIWVRTLGAGLDLLRGRLALRGHGDARHDASISDCPARISSARMYPLMFADAGDEAWVGVQVDPIADVGRDIEHVGVGIDSRIRLPSRRFRRPIRLRTLAQRQAQAQVGDNDMAAFVHLHGSRPVGGEHGTEVEWRYSYQVIPPGGPAADAAG